LTESAAKVNWTGTALEYTAFVIGHIANEVMCNYVSIHVCAHACCVAKDNTICHRYSKGVKGYKFMFCFETRILL